MGEPPVVTPGGIALLGNDWAPLDGVWPDEPPTISAVVVHYEQQDALDRTLLALRRQDLPSDRLQIVVVDDGSSTPPRVPDGVLLVVQEDRGFRAAAARNAGAAAATGSILCFLDADTTPEPGYLRAITRLPALAPDVVAVGRRRHAELSELSATARIELEAPALELPAPSWLADEYERTRNLLDSDDRSYRFVIGAVLACDAAFFAETTGFDESFDTYGGEDWEWAHRAWLAGAVFAHVPDAVAWHDGPEWSGRPEAALSRKNDEAIRLADLIPTPGSGALGLRGSVADIAVSVPPDADASRPAWFVSLDSIARELPLAALPGDDRHAERARLRIEVEWPVRVRPGALGSAIEAMAAAHAGRLTIIDSADRTLLTITSRRAAARATRWSRDDLFPLATSTVDGLEAIDDEVDVEAYLGGWG